MYLQRHQKKMLSNYILKYIIYCTICLLYCLEKCLKFLTKNAYIQTAISSKSFIFASMDAFNLIARNIFLIGGVSIISNIGLFIIKVFVCITTSASTYYYLDSKYQNSVGYLYFHINILFFVN